MAPRILRHYQTHAAQLQGEAVERMRAGITLGKFARGSGRVLDTIGEDLGYSRETVRKVLAVYQAAEADPVLYARCIEDLEADKLDGAYKRMLRVRDEARVQQLAPVDGRFRTLILDPPWDTDEISDVAGPGYALMSLAEIAALPVTAWADDAAHLYVWVTNNAIGEAYNMLAAWGFAYKTLHTWTKPHLGRGRYFRNTTEHFLFAVRGELRTKVAAQSVRTDHGWPVGEHSAKPDAFYDLVRACSFGPYGEAFQRTPRPDVENLFQPAALLEAAE